MQLRQLEYFLAVWEAGSFSGAAARLYVTQPSLSQQIGALEKELGAVLLERGRQGVTLTPAGRVFLPEHRTSSVRFKTPRTRCARWWRAGRATSTS